MDSFITDVVSPFIVGNPITGREMFFGREDVFAAVARALRGRHRDNVVTIYGQPRTGKTSILYQLPRFLGDRYCTVLVDVHALALNGLAGFLSELARYLSRALARSGVASVEMSLSPRFAGDARTAFEEFLETVGQRMGRRRLVVMFDEVIRLHDEVVAGRVEKGVFQYLRHLVQHYSWLDFVFCLGVDLESIPREFTSVLSVGLYKHISFLSEAAAVDLISKPVEAYYEVSPDAQRRILRLTGRHPYYTQLMCHCLFTRWSEHPKRTLTMSDVNAVVDLALELGSANLGATWADARGADRALMAGVAHRSARYGQSVSREDLGRLWGAFGVQLPDEELERAERRLVGREVLRGGKGFVFAVDLQRRWIRRQGRLEWVRDDLRADIKKWNRQLSRPRPSSRARVQPEDATVTGFTPLDIAALYNFPPSLDGSGECIGIVELGGGYRTKDVSAYFESINLPPPTITAVSVDGGENHPGSESVDAVVALSVEVCGAIAPGAHLVVYFAPNTAQGFVDAVRAVAVDRVNRPSVLSLSWGSPEEAWTRRGLFALNRALQAAAEAGITVCCAAGDGGSSDGIRDGRAHVDFPASSPWVLACGGTRIKVSGQPRRIESEVVWQEDNFGTATGGGISEKFDRPSWQEDTDITASANPNGRRGRALPDVAGHAGVRPGYLVRVGDRVTVVGGTAAVAPLWAGLIARINQGIGRRVGFINPLLYQRLGPAGVMRGITIGDNGAYKAGPGWNACTGWGVPDGNQLLLALRLIDPPAATTVDGPDLAGSAGIM